MNESEGVTCDEENISTIFFRTIHTGLRQSNIRNELRQILKEGDISDHDLLYEVSLACASEQERVKKMAEHSGKKVNINMLTLESDSDESNQGAVLPNSSASSSSSEQSKRGGKNSGKNAAKASQNAKTSQQKALNNGNTQIGFHCL